MDLALSISWTRDEAARRRAAFRGILGLNLFAHLVIGVTAIVAPRWLLSKLGLDEPGPLGWMYAWGGMLLLVTVLYAPGWLQPVRERVSNAVGILGRIGLAVLYLILGLTTAGGFLWLAAFDFVFAVWLAAAFQRLARAELMSRP
jgi:hypothetical protein